MDGLYSANPRLVPPRRLTFALEEEALELASLGAKMHLRSIEVAKRYQVNVRIASSSTLRARGLGS